MSYASIDILEQASDDKNHMLTSRKMAGFADWVVVNNMLAVDKLQDTFFIAIFHPHITKPKVNLSNLLVVQVQSCLNG
jgi:hypothetical protein